MQPLQPFYSNCDNTNFILEDLFINPFPIGNPPNNKSIPWFYVGLTQSGAAKREFSLMQKRLKS